MKPQQAIPEAAAIAFNAANAAFREKNFEAALAQAEVALRIFPGFAIALLMRARCLKAQGDLTEARQAYLAVLGTEPDNFSALLELGNIERQVGDTERAMRHYKGAISCRPGDHRGYLAAALLCTSQNASGHENRAAYYYHRALAAAGTGTPTVSDIHAELGRARLAKNQYAMALDSLRQAWASRNVDPNQDAVLLRDLAQVYFRLGLESDAQAALEGAARATDATILREIAAICYEANLWQEGIAVLRRAVTLHQSDINTHLALADMLSRCWKLEEAKAALSVAETVASLSPATKHQLLGKIASSLGDVETALGHYHSLFQSGADHAASSIAMTSLYSGSLAAKDVSDLHRSLFAPLGKGARPRSSFSNLPADDRPLRIGMVTADLHRQHPVNLFMQPLLRRWPQDDLPLTVYFTGNSYDAQTRLAKGRSAHWREVSYESLATEVERDGIDILIDLAGHTSNRAMACFAKRMAPVQVSYLGYPGSTGVPNMDWLIADKVVAPDGHSDQFSEKVMHLPNTVFCFAPEVDYPFPEFGTTAQDRPITFGSFNNVPKLTPDTIALWAQAMLAVKGSRLILKAPSFQDDTVVDRYLGMFGDHGITQDRIEFRGPSGLETMMREYGDVDIGLDPIHYGGGTTTLQAMWMGVPVLTLKGEKFASRMGASFMQAADLPAFVAEDADDFVAKAKEIASDRKALLALKQGLRKRLLSKPAWNADLFAGDFATCLRRIWLEAGKEQIGQS